MAISLYDISVGSYLQTVSAVDAFLARGREHLAAQGGDVNAFVETRLIEDMLPFRFQVVSVVHHSIHAVQALKTGEFGPPGEQRPLDYAGLQQIVKEALDGLKATTPAEINAREAHDVTFRMGSFALPFTATDFVLSFSLPNLHFHAATAYDMLRMKGVKLGKRDFLGQMRMKV